MASCVHDWAQAHCSNYTASTKICLQNLLKIYGDLGFTSEEQIAALEKIASSAKHIWTEAVDAVEHERRSQRDRVDGVLEEIQSIRRSLADEDIDVDLLECKEEAINLRAPLRVLHERVIARLEYYKGKRSERMAEFESVLAITSILKSQLGQPLQQSMPELSRNKLEQLKMEQDSLFLEKKKRIDLLEKLLDNLNEQCSIVGESSKQAALEVHHSLWNFREYKLSRVSKDHPYGTTLTAGVTKPSEEILQVVDLSDALFNSLHVKIQDMINLKGERETQLSELAAVLESLWDAMKVDAMSQERAVVSVLFQGPSKFHKSNIDMCAGEVTRLEQQKTQAMKDLVVSKARELEQICTATMMSAPDTTSLLIEMSQARKESTGQISDVLSKLVRMISEVQFESAKRLSIVSKISDLEQAREELKWLAKYEQDENRFKGRDCASNINRSNRALNLRGRVPSLLSSIEQAAQGWRLKEGAPFLVYGEDYAEVVLPLISKELESSIAEKSYTKVKSTVQPQRRVSADNHNLVTKTNATSLQSGGVKSHLRPPIPLSGASSKSQHGLTPRGLAERHSITVFPVPQQSPSGRLRGTSEPGGMQRTPPPAAGLSPHRSSASYSPTAFTMTPPARQSSLIKAASAASPGKDLMKEKMDRIMVSSSPKCTGGKGYQSPTVARMLHELDHENSSDTCTLKDKPDKIMSAMVKHSPSAGQPTDIGRTAQVGGGDKIVPAIAAQSPARSKIPRFGAH